MIFAATNIKNRPLIMYKILNKWHWVLKII
jgi:hypothetical protein